MSVASAGITGESNCSPNLFICPILKATGAFVNIISPPSSLTSSATFHAIDFLSKAPKIIPFLFFNRLYGINYFYKYKLIK